jgi:abequosyltransferase
MIAARIDELPADHPPIEVLVVDNASTDETAAVAARLSALFSQFRYERNESNLGIDGNIHRCSQLATGRWVQLFSDDDLMVQGALVTVIDRLRRHDEDTDFLFLNVISLTDKLPPPSQYQPRIPVREDVVCKDANQMVETCHIWLTFLSSFVFSREAWNRSTTLASYVGSRLWREPLVSVWWPVGRTPRLENKDAKGKVFAEADYFAE